ncbi:hypothetical protein SAMN05216388_10658 [Halorientalis persicus]|uniref:Uncharacterized protein n=1 Tax=Halorientalis persicus TaxID=1367881 RepID=A0A1H8WMB1_9EURY|nr:hypothetical protein SAMN05216388_10658 [Halorientalis persicus]
MGYSGYTVRFYAFTAFLNHMTLYKIRILELRIPSILCTQSILKRLCSRS